MGRKSADFLTLFLLCGRKNIRIPAYFLPSKIYRVGSSQILGYTSYQSSRKYCCFLGNFLPTKPTSRTLRQPQGGEVFKKGLISSPVGRRSVKKRHDCLPCGEEKCSKKA